MRRRDRGLQICVHSLKLGHVGQGTHGAVTGFRRSSKPGLPVRASLFGTRQHELFCGHRGRSYVLSVALPEFYHDSDKRYPVVYVLDGDALFGMVASLTVCAVWAQEAPELIA